MLLVLPLLALVPWVFVACMEHVDTELNSETDTEKGDTEVDSVPMLKRRAGYYKNSGEYRGGIYTQAEIEGQEHYSCHASAANRCTNWTGTGNSTDRGEESIACWTEPNAIDNWSCNHSLASNCSADAESTCDEDSRMEKRRCWCSKTENAKYCLEWFCVKLDYDGDFEEQHFQCDSTNREDYCEWWKGQISSEKKIKSVVCRCQSTNETLCDDWSCEMRGMVRCEGHSGWWCNYWVAVLGGGGVAVFIIIAASTFSLLMEEPHLALPLSIPALFMMIGVVIWGGVRALPIVGALWFFALLLPLWIAVCRPTRVSTI